METKMEMEMETETEMEKYIDLSQIEEVHPAQLQSIHDYAEIDKARGDVSQSLERLIDGVAKYASSTRMGDIMREMQGTRNPDAILGLVREAFSHLGWTMPDDQ